MRLGHRSSSTFHRCVRFTHPDIPCPPFSGQRHLIYILSVLASRPTVLIADEMLCGLDIDRQASVLTMLQRLQARTGLTILYLSVDLAPISIVVRAPKS